MSAFLIALRTRGLYMWAIFLIPALSIFGHAVAPNQPFVRGQDLGITAAFVLTGVAGFLWIAYRGKPDWTSGTWWFIGIVLIAWGYQLSRTHLDASLFNISAFVVPVLLLMVALKAVCPVVLRRALLILGYSLVLISLLSIIFGSLDWMPDGFRVSDAGTQRLSFMQWIGVENRWGGPFGSVNYSSPIGGLLIIIGIGQRIGHREILVVSGVAIMALGGGRTTFFAVVAGLLIWILWSARIRRSPRVLIIRSMAVGAYLVVGLLYIRLLDPSLNGRSAIWGTYVPLLADQPIIGVGTSGLQEFVQSMSGKPGFIPFDHVHSVLLDGTVRFGIIMGVLTIAILVIASVVSIRALSHGNRLPMALVVYVAVAGVTETIHGWNYWTVYLAALLWAVLSSDPRRTSPDERREALGNSVSLPNASI